jgi:hypothetical protein
MKGSQFKIFRADHLTSPKDEELNKSVSKLKEEGAWLDDASIKVGINHIYKSLTYLEMLRHG